MGVDHIPSVDRPPAPPREEEQTPAVEPRRRLRPVTPSREDRWERSDERPKRDRESPPGTQEDAGEAESEPAPGHLDERA